MERDQEPTRPLEPVPGSRQLDRYRIRRELGRGGMGVVYLATDESLSREVALKVLRDDVLVTDEARERFEREIALTARLEHPNIVRLYDSGRDGQASFFTMEYVQGKPLEDRLIEERLDPAQALKLLLPLCRAVAYAHDNGVLHRDIKPANVLLDEAGTPKLTDFGLAGTLDAEQQSARLTESQSTMGTPNYMPPEQAEGNTRLVDQRGDVYSLGAVLYEMLTERPPFDEGHIIRTLQAVVWGQLVPPRKHNPTIHPEIETICLKALERRREKRYQTPQALAEDIEAFLAGRPIKARPPGRMRRVLKWMKRHPVVQAGTAVVIAALGVIGYLQLRPGHLEVPAMTGGATLRIAGDTISLDETQKIRLWPPRTYAWRIERPGFHAARGEVRIYPGGTASVAPLMRPHTGRLSVSSPIAEVPIRLTRQQSGEVWSEISPLRKLRLPIGRYELLAQRENYKPYRATFDMKRGATVTLRMLLPSLIAKRVSLPERMVGRPLLLDWDADGFVDIAVETASGIYLVHGPTREATRLVRLPHRIISDHMQPHLASGVWSDPGRQSLFLGITLSVDSPATPFWTALAEVAPDGTLSVVDSTFSETRPVDTQILTTRDRTGRPYVVWSSDVAGVRIVAKGQPPRRLSASILCIGGLLLEDLEGDGVPEIVAVTNAGRILVMNLSGKVLGQAKTHPRASYPYLGRHGSHWILATCAPPDHLGVLRVNPSRGQFSLQITHNAKLPVRCNVSLAMSSPSGRELLVHTAAGSWAFDLARQTWRDLAPPEMHNVPIWHESTVLLPLGGRITARRNKKLLWLIRSRDTSLPWLSLGDLDGDGWSELVAATPRSANILIGYPYGSRHPLRFDLGSPSVCKSVPLDNSVVFVSRRRSLRRVSSEGVVEWERSLPGHPVGLWKARWGADALLLVLVQEKVPLYILVDPATGRPHSSIPLDMRPELVAASTSPAGIFSISGRWLMFHSQTGEFRRDLGSEDWAALQVVEDGLLLTSATGTVGVFSPETSRWRWRVSLPAPVDLAPARVGDELVVGVDGQLSVFDFTSGKLLRKRTIPTPIALWVVPGPSPRVRVATEHSLRTYELSTLDETWQRDLLQRVLYASRLPQGKTALATASMLSVLDKHGRLLWRRLVADTPSTPPRAVVLGKSTYVMLQYESRAHLELIPLGTGISPLWNAVSTRSAGTADAEGQRIRLETDASSLRPFNALVRKPTASRAGLLWRLGRKAEAFEIGSRLWTDAANRAAPWWPLCLLEMGRRGRARDVLASWLKAGRRYGWRDALEQEGKRRAGVVEALKRAAKRTQDLRLLKELELLDADRRIISELRRSLREQQLQGLRGQPERIAEWLEAFCTVR